MSKTPRWNGFGRTLKCCAKGMLRYRVVHQTPLPEQPCVYVVHHQNLFGPIHAVACLPESHMWVYWKFCRRKSCFDQYYHYTFTQRFGWPKPAAAVVSGVLSLVIPGLFSAIGAVPVYRGDTRLRQTMRTSVDLLSEGHSIVLCPDVDYQSKSAFIGETYAGFAGIAGMTRSHSGVDVAFIPVHCSREEKTIYTGTPIYCAEGRAGRQACAQQIARALNGMAGARQEETAAACEVPEQAET